MGILNTLMLVWSRQTPLPMRRQIVYLIVFLLYSKLYLRRTSATFHTLIVDRIRRNSA